MKVPDLRNKILFTIFMLAIYRLGSYLPTPGIDQNAVNAIKEQAEQGGVLAFLTLFSGKALTQFALFALGIMPYITSSIIMQILTVVIPKLQQWQEQGAVGQRKTTQWTRYLTIAIALLQSTGLVFLFHNGGGGLVSSDSNIDLVPNFGVFRWCCSSCRRSPRARRSSCGWARPSPSAASATACRSSSSPRWCRPSRARALR
ncbi:MAG: hypothetical protein V9G12_23595 [Microthrixaceae bacterium]